MTTKNDTKSVFDVIYDMEKTAQIVAWRSVAHSMMAKCIGSIRQEIRNRAYQVRNEELPISTEQRNEQDGLEEQEAPYGMENNRVEPILQASQFHALYDWSTTEVKNLSDSAWDEPMSVEDMLAFMVQKAVPTDKAFLEALATAANTTVENIKTFQEAQEKQEREQLTEQMPEILETFKGFSENGYEGCDEALDIITQHQLAIKIVEGLVKAKNKALERALRNRKLTELGSIPLFDDGIAQMSEWVKGWEKKNKAELRDAMEAGRNIRTLDDVA